MSLLLLTTGGTIATGRNSSGQVLPIMAGEKLVRTLGLDSQPLEVQAPFTVPSSHMDWTRMWEVRNHVLAARARGIAGVIITHGTDTIEETAFFLRCTLPPDYPVVLTGAMRASHLPGYDGPANLSAAIVTAQYLVEHGGGTVVVMNDEIHAAELVTKAHTSNPAAFTSAPFGPLGVVQEGRAYVPLRLENNPHLNLYGELPAASAGEPAVPLFPEVELIKIVAGGSPALLRHAMDRGVLGVVLEGTGGGHVPPDHGPVIEEALDRGLVVAMCSRCLAGYPLRSTYSIEGGEVHLRSIGVVNCRLSGPKTRILMALLGLTGRGPDEIRSVIDSV